MRKIFACNIACEKNHIARIKPRFIIKRTFSHLLSHFNRAHRGVTVKTRDRSSYMYIHLPLRFHHDPREK